MTNLSDYSSLSRILVLVLRWMISGRFFNHLFKSTTITNWVSAVARSCVFQAIGGIDGR